MSDNSVLRRTFSLKWEEVTRESCIVISFMVKSYSNELHGLYSSPNIRVIKSRRMRWAGHIA